MPYIDIVESPDSRTRVCGLLQTFLARACKIFQVWGGRFTRQLRIRNFLTDHSRARTW